MKTKQHYMSLQPVKPQPTYTDTLKALGYILAMFGILTIPFFAGWIDMFLSFLFR